MILQMEQKTKFWKLGPCTFNVNNVSIFLKIHYKYIKCANVDVFLCNLKRMPKTKTNNVLYHFQNA